MNRIFLIAVVCIAVVTSTEIKGVRRTRHIVKRQTGGGCMYEGKVYQQGQTWTVPCKYNCVCKDGTAGAYSCTEVCPHYDTLPDGCFMQKDPNSPCCSAPKCNFQPSGGSGSGAGQVITGTSAPIQMGSGSQHSGSFMSGGTCHDTLGNCANYGQSVCSDPAYTQWVKQNCAKFCNACGGTSGSMSSGSSGGGGTSGGDGGFSLHFGTSAPMISSGGGSMTGSCADKINNCAAFSTSVCSDPQYAPWVAENCPRFCNKCGMTGGTMTGTGGTMTGTGTGGTMTGTGSCADKANCASFGTAICTNSAYAAFARDQCSKYCNLCSSGGTMTGTGGTLTGTGTGGSGYLVPVPGGSGTLTGTGGTGGSGTLTGTGGTGGTMTGTGGSGTLTGTGGTDGSGIITGGTGGSGTLIGTGGTGGTMTGTGGSGTLTGTGGTGGSGTLTGTGGGSGTLIGTGGTGGSGTLIGTGGTGGTMTGTGSCMDKVNCAQYGRSFCTNTAYTAFAQDSCRKYCNLCSGDGTNGACADKLHNCANYGKSVCSDQTYAGWVKENCPAYCGQCGSMTGGTGTMTGGTGTMTGTGGVYYPGGTGTGGTGSMTGGTGTMTGGTGTMTGGTGGSGGTMTGTSTGCVYKGQVYQQGQTWKDGCTYTCTCADAANGRYSCTGLCVQWNLPSSCRLNPPAAGKCCQTPNCPSNVQINYPPGYTEL